MKAYTDIEQSKKLAEILPIKSADMIWILSNPDLPMIKAIAYKDSEKSKYYETLPAWSLSALMNIIEIEKVEICFNCNNNKYWVDVYFESLGSFCQDHELYDSKIDALIAIIKKLKNRNVL